MSYALNLYETQDEYTEAGTLHCPGSRKLDIQVSNAAIYYQISRPSPAHPEGGPWEPEVHKAPATYLLLRNAAKVRVRSAVAGTPATVTIDALTEED